MDRPPNLPKPPDPKEAALRRVARFHTILTAVNPDEPVDWEGRPQQFLHYGNPLSRHPLLRPLLRPPPRRVQELTRVRRPAAVLYSTLFCARQLIRTAPLDHASISQFLFDCVAVAEGEPAADTGFLPRVASSCGGSHPTVAHVVAPAVPGLFSFPCTAHYSPEDHVLEVRAKVDPEFFSGTLPDGALLVGLSTIYARETWRHGNRAFRHCHLDVGHAIAAVAFAAAALGWDVRLLAGLGDPDIVDLMGAGGFRPWPYFRGRQRPGYFPDVELQDPICVLVVFPNNVGSFYIDEYSLSFAISEHFGSIDWTEGGTPTPLFRGEHVVYSEVYRTAEDVERCSASNSVLHVPGNRFWASESSPGFPGYENVMVREVVRARWSSPLMDPGYQMEAETFYQFLHHCLPSGDVKPPEVQKKQCAFPFVVLPWDSRTDAFIVVHRVKTMPEGLYCLVRNQDHFDLLKRKTSPIFQWQQTDEWLEMGLPLYRLLPGDLEEKIAEIAFRKPFAMNSCFTIMIVGPCGDVLDIGLWTYPQLFWEAGVFGHLLSLDAQALSLSAHGIGSFFDKRARRLLTPESGFFQTLYLYSVGKPLPE